MCEQPYELHVDRTRRLVEAIWGEKVTDAMLIRYQTEVWLKSDLEGFAELHDFSQVRSIDVTSEGLQRLAALAVQSDHSERRDRVAIVVQSSVGTGMARMYQAYRGLCEGSRRDVEVFEDRDSALLWLSGQEQA